MEFAFLSKVIITSRYVYLSIKLCLDVGNDDYITLRVILAALSRAILKLEHRVTGSKRKLGLKWFIV